MATDQIVEYSLEEVTQEK